MAKYNFDIVPSRVTLDYLLEFAKEKFKEFEIKNYVPVSIERTHYTSDQYEGGAARMIVSFDLSDESKRDTFTKGYFMCFYSCSDYLKHLKSGYKLKLCFSRNSDTNSLSGLEIDLKKS